MGLAFSVSGCVRTGNLKPSETGKPPSHLLGGEEGGGDRYTLLCAGGRDVGAPEIFCVGIAKLAGRGCRYFFACGAGTSCGDSPRLLDRWLLSGVILGSVMFMVLVLATGWRVIVLGKIF